MTDASPVQTALRRLTMWTVVLYVLLATAAGASFYIRSLDIARIERQSDRNVTAFCALRHDLERRIEDGLRFLEEHPGGIPGISAEQLRQSIQDQRVTVRALSIVVCPPEPVEGSVVVSPREQARGLINERRFSAGCDPLRATGDPLIESARAHSRLMADADRLFHSELNLGDWSLVGEVLGTAERWEPIIDALFHSPEHRRILLDCRYDRIALGFVWRDSVWLTGRLYAT
jgi:uncharacterized protein YkwD